MGNAVYCPKCGSQNVNIQVIQENHGVTSVTKTKGKIKQKKHGLLWWLTIGWWWWIIDIFLWIFLFPFRLAAGLLKKKKYKKSETSVTKQHAKIAYRKVCTCQDCGSVWSEEV